MDGSLMSANDKNLEAKPTTSTESVAPPPDSSNPTTSGRRAAFRDVRRQLTDDELKSSGVQKLLLDNLLEADDEREELRVYVNLFHEADKTAAVLAIQVKAQDALDVFFGVGVGLGGAVIGLVPFFLGVKPEYGIVCGIVGLGLMIGATIGRGVIKKRTENEIVQTIDREVTNKTGLG
jgi:hypothetical protein